MIAVCAGHHTLSFKEPSDCDALILMAAKAYEMAET